MGSFFSMIADLFRGKKELKLLMVGLDHAGKSTIVNAMQLGKPTTIGTKPTIGFDLEELTFKNFKLKVWDISGQLKYRELWKHYYEGANGIIFVLDSADKERVSEAKEEFQRMLGEQSLDTTRILIFANKQDLPNAMTVKEIKGTLGLTMEFDKKVRVQEACARKYEGLYEGFSWLINEIDAILSKQQFFFFGNLLDIHPCT
eukprot:TRINITY_DN1173_c0_g1_i1.p2 TRINITY_DN1173_c0_g1~~TRINITY_DN1173_c0_g1_i1.p2  ORF type:complete len:202 (+),score=34.02 TRINITY_DN1173_c0_g1_i1:39-644(+)